MVDVSASDSFEVLGCQVRGFTAGVGQSGDAVGFEFFLPCGEGAQQGFGFVHAGGFHRG